MTVFFCQELTNGLRGEIQEHQVWQRRDAISVYISHHSMTDVIPLSYESVGVLGISDEGI